MKLSDICKDRLNRKSIKNQYLKSRYLIGSYSYNGYTNFKNKQWTVEILFSTHRTSFREIYRSYHNAINRSTLRKKSKRKEGFAIGFWYKRLSTIKYYAGRNI